MNTEYKYSVEEITEYDHGETWFENLEQAQLCFDKNVRQALFRLSNRASVVESNGDESIVRHCIIKYTGNDRVFVELLLKENK